MDIAPQNDLPDIDEIAPLSEDDKQCFKEIRDVLKRHDKLSRFGVMLLHRHFSVNRDEVLLETCDEENRTLTLKPVKSDLLKDGDVIETNWRLDLTGPIAKCNRVCYPTPNGHNPGHVYNR